MSLTAIDFSDKERSRVDFLDNKGFSPAQIAESVKRGEGEIIAYLRARNAPKKSDPSPKRPDSTSRSRKTEDSSSHSRRTEDTKEPKRRRTPEQERIPSKASKSQAVKETKPQAVNDTKPARDLKPEPTPEIEERICFSCGKTGHFSRQCPTKAQDIRQLKDLRDLKACFECGRIGHTERRCPFTGSKTSEICFKCHQTGHSAKRCPNRVGGDRKVVESNHNEAWVGNVVAVPQDPNTIQEKDSLREDALFGSHTNTGIRFESYYSIPVVVKSNGATAAHDIKSVSSFDELGLGPIIRNNLQLAGWKTPTPIQKYALPIGMSGRDLLGCAQTGSGKTAAYLIPIIHRLLDNPKPKLSSNQARPRVLIMAPVRELAQQIHVESAKFCYRSALRPVCVYGGSGYKDQQIALEKGCDILIGTPGRLSEFYGNNSVSFADVQFLCIDEADCMLNMGFISELKQLIEACPSENRQTLMFSATFPKEIQYLAKNYLKPDYFFCSVGRVGSTIGTISQKAKYVCEREKFRALLDELHEHPCKTLVFVKCKREAETIAHRLQAGSIRVCCIHGNREQHQREAALQKFKSGEALIMLATDVAARGLDIPHVGHVINYDMTNKIDEYVHRIGRTGRVGHEGLATSFITRNNASVAGELVAMLEEQKQEVEQWLRDLAQTHEERNDPERKKAQQEADAAWGAWRTVPETKVETQDVWGNVTVPATTLV